jgi:hypothetical protein
MYLIAIGWLYVALMMSVAEALHPTGTVLGGIVTFVGYGLLPTALVLYIGGTPGRRRRRREADAHEADAHEADAHGTDTPEADAQPGNGSALPPDRGGHPAGDAVAPERKEP